METNIQRDKAAAKKAPAKTKVAAVDPFADAVDATPAKKRASKSVPGAVATGAVKKSPVKKAAKKTAKEITLDPFAEVVETVSPVKKRAAKSVLRAVATGEVITEKPKAKRTPKKATVEVTVDIVTAKPKVALSPTYKALAAPVLPELGRENRARLQMQTPTRLYFYWSVKENPWALLKNVFGDDLGSYALVVKLIDKKRGFEEIHQVDAAGNWWFAVEPDGSYEAEIGFYAPNRPYFRILHSNTVETPRRRPSPRAATEADWVVTANEFAEVLDIAGFSWDAFDVAMAGDDPIAAAGVSHTAFSHLLGPGDYDLRGIVAEDIRYAILALASGARLEDLRFKISNALFTILQANAGNLETGRAMSALTENFDIDEAEFTEEQRSPAVYGASIVNFPRTLKTRTLSDRTDYR